MNTKLIAALIVAMALAASHWKVYVMGKTGVKADWDQSIIVANEAARETEKMRRQAKETADANRIKSLTENAIAADRARRASDGLRNESERSLQASRDSHAACIVSAATHSELLGYCESSYRDMAGKAQGHATDIKALIEAWPK